MFLLYIGHSHLTALQRGAGLLEPDEGGNTRVFKRMDNKLTNPKAVREAGGWDAVKPAVARAMNEILSPLASDVIVSCIGGNMHSVLGLTNSPRPFDFVLPERPDLEMQGGVDVVPYGMVRRQLKTSMLPHLDMMLIARRPGKRVLHLAPPPPIESAQHISAFPNKFADRIEEFGIAPAVLRWKFWHASVSIMQELCAEADIEFLSVPAAACTPSGFLATQCWADDPVHGNATYGALVLRNVDRHLAGDRE